VHLIPLASAITAIAAAAITTPTTVDDRSRRDGNLNTGAGPLSQGIA